MYNDINIEYEDSNPNQYSNDKRTNKGNKVWGMNNQFNNNDNRNNPQYTNNYRNMNPNPNKNNPNASLSQYDQLNQQYENAKLLMHVNNLNPNLLNIKPNMNLGL